MMMDNERVVHQGQFLLEWKGTAARLIFQYATEKMTPDQKARFRKTKAVGFSS